VKQAPDAAKVVIKLQQMSLWTGLPVFALRIMMCDFMDSSYNVGDLPCFIFLIDYHVCIFDVII
jgi:hypothetical protein